VHVMSETGGRREKLRGRSHHETGSLGPGWLFLMASMG